MRLWLITLTPNCCKKKKKIPRQGDFQVNLFPLNRSLLQESCDKTSLYEAATTNEMGDKSRERGRIYKGESDMTFPSFFNQDTKFKPNHKLSALRDGAGHKGKMTKKSGAGNHARGPLRNIIYARQRRPRVAFGGPSMSPGKCAGPETCHDSQTQLVYWPSPWDPSDNGRCGS